MIGAGSLMRVGTTHTWCERDVNRWKVLASMLAFTAVLSGAGVLASTAAARHAVHVDFRGLAGGGGGGYESEQHNQVLL